MTWVFFDVNGTLLDPGELEPALQKALQLAWTTTLSGGYVHFDVLVGYALGEPVGDRLAAMPARRGARAALQGLRDAGLRLGALSQGRTQGVEAALHNAGLRDLFDVILGGDQTEAFKPDPRPYAHAVGQTGRPAGEVWLVAAHWWDVYGAKRAGLRTAYVGSRGGLPGLVPAPDVVAADLGAAAAAVAG